MDELESQIREVLGDPQQMAQIMGLAQSLMGGGEQPPPAPPEKRESPLSLPGGGSDQQALLRAVRPYLSEKRQRKIDRALQITRMAHLAKAALKSFGGEEHAETLSGQQRAL